MNNIAQPGTRPKLSLTPKSAPIPPCTPAAQPTPAAPLLDHVGRRAESLAAPLELFWLVWAPRYKPPKFRHSTLESAQTEATRLRGLNPGIEYIVYRCEQVRP